MSGPHNARGCQCGRYAASEAGYQQMSPRERARFDAAAIACCTCAYDRTERARQERAGSGGA